MEIYFLSKMKYMNLKSTYITLALSAVTFISCANINNEVQQQTTASTQTSVAAESPALKKRLQPIRDNFTRINNIKKWTSIEKKDVLEESTEGGVATFYYANNRLEKIITTFYGEMGKLVSEYYILDGELSFVFEQFHQYNRPIYYDKAWAKENGDNEWFDEKKTQIIERRYYFDNETLFHQKTGEENDDDAEILALESQRIKEMYEKMIILQID